MNLQRFNQRKRFRQEPDPENNVQHVPGRRRLLPARKKIVQSAEERGAPVKFSEPCNVNSQKPSKHKIFSPDSDSENEEEPELKKGKVELVEKKAAQLSKLEPYEFPNVANIDSRKSKKRKFEPQDPKSGNEVERQSNKKTFERVTQRPQKTPVQRASKANRFQHILSVPFSNFSKSNRFWEKIPFRGPYNEVFSRLCDDTFRNSPLRNLIRRLLDKVYRSLLEYREKDFPLLTQRFNESRTPTVDDAIAIAEEMCQKVFRFVDDDGLSIDLYEDNMVSALRILFYSKDLNIPYSSEIFRRLKSLCASKNVNATSEELEDVRNRLVYFCFHLSRTLLLWVLYIDVKCPDQIAIRRKVNRFVGTSEFYSKPARFKCFPSFLMSRDKSVPSLWVTIPCEDRDYLLEFAIDYGLIKQLPEEAKTFLTKWIVDVRKRMRNRLRKGDLRRNIEKYMAETNHGEQISLEDVRLEGIITAVLDNALNTKEFRVFDSAWKESTLYSIKTMDNHKFIPSQMNFSMLENASEELDPASLDRFSSCFPNSLRQNNLISHCLQHILHFVIRFAMSTIRHIFQVEKFTLTYDLQFDEETTGFQSCYENTARETQELKTPKSESSSSSFIDTKPTPKVHVIRPRAILLPTPAYPARPPVTSFPECSDPGVQPPNMWSGQNRATFMPTIPNDSYPVSSQPFIPGYPQQGFEEPPINSIDVPLEEPPAKRPKTELSNNSTISDDTEEELNKARALRPSSVVSASRDIFEEVPEEWVIIGKAELEKNKKLIAELERSRERLDTLLSRVD